MRRSTFSVFIVLALMFLIFGSVLPDPAGHYSTSLRRAANQFIVGLFPKSGPKVNPNERTERQLEETENRN